MEMILLDKIPFEPDFGSLIKKLRIEPDTEDASRICELIEEARQTARPKALFSMSFIDDTSYNTVTIEGVSFKSKILASNLEHLNRVFPYAATCGAELDIWASKIVDPLERFWVGEIQELALASAVEMLRRSIMEKYEVKNIACMNPGSLEDWPINQQKPLFSLLGDVTGKIGVRLTDSMLMLPVKSVSGIFFTTDMDYENCRLCQREKCPGRRVPFNPVLYKSNFS